MLSVSKLKSRNNKIEIRYFYKRYFGGQELSFVTIGTRVLSTKEPGSCGVLQKFNVVMKKQKNTVFFFLCDASKLRLKSRRHVKRYFVESM